MYRAAAALLLLVAAAACDRATGPAAARPDAPAALDSVASQPDTTGRGGGTIGSGT